MDFNHIKDYLNKFKELLSSKQEIYGIISLVVEKNINIKIEQKLIQIKPPFIYIKASPLIRNEILMRKEKILKEILETSPKSNFKDIK